jgi:DNA repair ATPase RecN
MKSRFYIKDIAASGDKVEFSSVSFTSGINIMYGPSNSGKSYVINCINFMMGAKEAPFSRASTGYDTVHMSMESVDGNIVKMKRKIVAGTKTDVGANIVEVVSNMSEIKSGEYSISKLEYSQFLLKLMGIEDGHKIISTQEFKI